MRSIFLASNRAWFRMIKWNNNRGIGSLVIPLRIINFSTSSKLTRFSLLRGLLIKHNPKSQERMILNAYLRHSLINFRILRVQSRNRFTTKKLKVQGSKPNLLMIVFLCLAFPILIDCQKIVKIVTKMHPLLIRIPVLRNHLYSKSFSILK